jgi:RNA 2',3'-cyclic 3'-phosphodiesterase
LQEESGKLLAGCASLGSMSKLFVAVDFPAPAVEALTRLQPPPAPGIRPSAADQLHLTLHFIGEADAGRVIDALQTVRFATFTLTLEGVGQFPSAGGDVTLWAGVRDTGKLVELHRAMAAALTLKGFPIESRPFNPHVTLARCKSGVSPELVQEFLQRHASFRLEGISIPGFWLYSSSLVANVPVYRRERGFELIEPGSSG